MTPRRHNAAFLTPEELAGYGIENAAERRILIHSTAVTVNFDAIRFVRNIRIDPYVVLSCSDLQIGNYVHISTDPVFLAPRQWLGRLFEYVRL